MQCSWFCHTSWWTKLLVNYVHRVPTMVEIQLVNCNRIVQSTAAWAPHNIQPVFAPHNVFKRAQEHWPDLLVYWIKALQARHRSIIQQNPWPHHFAVDRPHKHNGATQLSGTAAFTEFNVQTHTHTHKLKSYAQGRLLVSWKGILYIYLLTLP